MARDSEGLQPHGSCFAVLATGEQLAELEFHDEG